jgi:hypothetical protein
VEKEIAFVIALALEKDQVHPLLPVMAATLLVVHLNNSLAMEVTTAAAAAAAAAAVRHLSRNNNLPTEAPPRLHRFLTLIQALFTGRTLLNGLLITQRKLKTHKRLQVKRLQLKHPTVMELLLRRQWRSSLLSNMARMGLKMIEGIKRYYYNKEEKFEKTVVKQQIIIFLSNFS